MTGCGDERDVTAAEDDDGREPDEAHRQETRRHPAFAWQVDVRGSLFVERLPDRRVDPPQQRRERRGGHLEAEDHPRRREVTAKSDRDDGPEHEGQLDDDAVGRERRAAILVARRGDDALTDDGERRHGEQPGQCREQEQRHIADEGRHGPAPGRDEDRRRDDPAQPEGVEQAPAPRPRQRDGEGRGRRDETCLRPGAVQRLDDVDREQHRHPERRDADGEAEQQQLAGAAVGKNAAVTGGGHGGVMVSRACGGGRTPFVHRLEVARSAVQSPLQT